MPIGGLKWRNELEPREFRQVKSEVQVLGIDDAPFERGDDEVKIVAVLSRGAKMVDGVFHSSIKRDGVDATGKIARLVRSIRRENARAIFLDGVTFGGFNVVDIKALYRETGIPVIACMDRHPDYGAIRDALKNLPEGEKRLVTIKGGGPIHEAGLQGVGKGGTGAKAYFQCAGIKPKDAQALIKVATINGISPEPIRVAHLIAKGAYTEIPEMDDGEEGPHVKAYHFIRKKHKEAKRLKGKYFPGFAGEVFSFLFALLIAWLFIQFLGWALATPAPLVVVESESMIHTTGWDQWPYNQNLNPDSFGFDGGMNVGDIVLVKGDEPGDYNVGDVIVYTKYDLSLIGGEPIIHRVIGILDVNGTQVKTEGAVSYSGGMIVTPCDSRSAYTLDEIRAIYTNPAIIKLFPGISTDSYRLFITKGDNNAIEDQCKTASLISFPVHEELVQGRAKIDIPYLGYVKLGLVCAYRYASGSACECRCWWPANHPKCCK